MLTHSFAGQYNHFETENFNCEDCEFTSTTVETMEVHVGKCRTENFECGLCQYTCETLEGLELHLASCEVYECDNCELRSRFLKEVKTHIEKEHEKPCNIFHIKMDRNDPSLVDFKSYRSDKI